VVLWRHGQTSWNLEGRFQGQTDIELDQVGRDQAADSAARLASLQPDAVVSSDLRRATATASALARLVGRDVVVDARLRESHGGDWQGLTGSEIRGRFSGEFDAWLRGEDVRASGGGETRSEVARRTSAAVRDALAPLPAGATLVVVTHGGAARTAIGTLLGLPQQRWTTLGALSNCSWSVLEERDGPWVLLEHNAGSLPEPVLGDDR
jgi:probable phosphoglycerate mutase